MPEDQVKAAVEAFKATFQISADDEESASEV
jgi:hypothetical protein